MNITIQSFDIAAYEEVLALWKRCEGIGLSDADSRTSIMAYLERNPGMSFLAMSGEKIVGSILGGHDGRRGYIHHLAVDVGWRKQGIARRLVENCLQVLKASRIQKIHVFVFEENENAIAIWRSLGWSYRTDLRMVSKVI